MSTLPIEPHLLELLRTMEQQGFRLIVAGGLSIYLKRRFIAQTGRPTLFTALPEARATDDIDSFLSLEIFLHDHVARFSDTLRALGYQAHAKARYFQFTKPVPGLPAGHVKIDLHARLPHADEAAQIKVQEPRLGRRGTRAFRTLHAWATPEAFAIDHGVQELPLTGRDPAGQLFTGRIHIPHPFASLCMKIAAARDHEHRPEPQPRHRKHAHDVYLLTAMLDATEFSQVQAHAHHFAAAPAMPALRHAVTDLFATPDSPACRTLRDQLRGQPGEPTPVDLTRFCAALRELFA